MDFELFHSLLAETSWAPVLESSDVTIATGAFYDIMYGLFDLTVPKKKRQTVKCNRYPVWFDADIIRDIRRKTKLHKFWLKSKCITSFELFSNLRASLKVRISQAYKSHMARIGENLQLRPQQFWNYVHSLKSKGGFEPCVLYKGSSCTGIEAAEAFAKYFASVFLDEVPSLNVNLCSEQSWHDGCVDIPAVLPEDIERGIRKLKSESSPGPDNLPSFILKTSKKHIILPLYHIFNLSLTNGKYPTQWKLSRVTPIPKSSKKTLVEEYRPIAILCAPAKVFEYILHNEIYRQVKHQIGEEQHGFRSGRSVNTNLLGLVDYISGAMDRGSQVDVIYFDFQKAFDKIDNDKLLQKLSSPFGFSRGLLNFYSDFLKDRSQYVKHGTYESGAYHTRSGVSQGSVTGPLLFQMMIHDLLKVLTSAKCLLYADDLKLYLEIKSLDDCMSLQSDINRVYEWSVENKMIFNVSKCNIMTFDRKRNPIHFNYCLDNVPINRVNRIKDLGVTFDRNLTFHDHVSDLAKEAYRRLGFVLRNAKDFENPHVVRILYNSLVRSKLESSACVWNPHHARHLHTNAGEGPKNLLKVTVQETVRLLPVLVPNKVFARSAWLQLS